VSSRAVVAALALMAISGPIDVAAKPKPPEGRIIYVQKGAVWRASLAQPDKPEKLLKLPAAAGKLTRLEAAGDGSALLVDLGRNAAWLDLSGDPVPPPVFLPCRGRAHLSPGGEIVLCASRVGNGTVAYRLRPRLGSSLLAGFNPAATALADQRGERVVTADRDALWGASIARPDQRVRVAPHVPTGVLSIAPDGQRAVGRYHDGQGSDSLFGFRLDGQAARRKLGPGAPIAWSADSVWLAIFDQDIACAVRAVGGEYKCWNKYRPLAIDHDGSWLLIAKPFKGRARKLDLFLAQIAGPHSEKPLKLLSGAAAATLVP
jgi:hypothetical protein